MKRVLNGRPFTSNSAALAAEIASHSVTETEEFSLRCMLPIEEVVDVITTAGPWDVGMTDRGRIVVSRFLFEGHQVCYAHDLHIFFSMAEAMLFLSYREAARRLM